MCWQTCLIVQSFIFCTLSLPPSCSACPPCRAGNTTRQCINHAPLATRQQCLLGSPRPCTRHSPNRSSLCTLLCEGDNLHLTSQSGPDPGGITLLAQGPPRRTLSPPAPLRLRTALGACWQHWQHSLIASLQDKFVSAGTMLPCSLAGNRIDECCNDDLLHVVSEDNQCPNIFPLPEPAARCTQMPGSTRPVAKPGLLLAGHVTLKGIIFPFVLACNGTTKSEVVSGPLTPCASDCIDLLA